MDSFHFSWFQGKNSSGLLDMCILHRDEATKPLVLSNRIVTVWKKFVEDEEKWLS